MNTAVVLGASANPDRYSHQAVARFAANGWRVLPVHPSGMPVAGVPCLRSLSDIAGPVDVVSVYVNPGVGVTAAAAIRALAPRLVILNPGADGPQMVAALDGLRVLEACTLVLLARPGGIPLDVT